MRRRGESRLSERIYAAISGTDAHIADAAETCRRPDDAAPQYGLRGRRRIRFPPDHAQSHSRSGPIAPGTGPDAAYRYGEARRPHSGSRTRRKKPEPEARIAPPEQSSPLFLINYDGINDNVPLIRFLGRLYGTEEKQMPSLQSTKAGSRRWKKKRPAIRPSVRLSFVRPAKTSPRRQTPPSVRPW